MQTQNPETVVEVDETGDPVTRVDLQLEREKIQLERERMALEREKLASERERWKLEEGWRVASERVVRVRLITVFLVGTCCLLFGCLLGGIWLVTQQERLDEERAQAAANRRRQLVQALTTETNLTGRAEVLLQSLQGSGDGVGGILLLLD